MNDLDSGTACLFMICCYYKNTTPLDELRKMFEGNLTKESITGIAQVAEKMGFRARRITLTYKQLITDISLPCIVQLNTGKFIVMMPRLKWGYGKKVRCADPGNGSVVYTKEELLALWAIESEDGLPVKGVALLLEPSFKFYTQHTLERSLTWRLAIRYFRNSRRQVVVVLLAFILGSLIQLIFPFLMQSIVDVGINSKNISFIYIVLIAQLILTVSKISVNFIRSFLTLRITSLFNLTILTDFWIKLAHLPMSFFEQPRFNMGSIMQRITDNKQIPNFLTGSAPNTFFSLLNFLVLAVVLMLYKIELFLIFAVGTILYGLWMRFFLGIRKELNYKAFHEASKANNHTIQFLQGMEEIKLQNIAQQRRWEWENIQASIFKLDSKSIVYSQLQRGGATLINSGKDMVLTLVVAKLVIAGQLTFGAMFAVQYIIGQLAEPIEQFIGFIQTAQDAKISMDRLNEIHNVEDEEQATRNYVTHLPANRSIKIRNLSFAYPGDKSGNVLHNIDLDIPEGKTTAIVGLSGSGKTTLLKLLLKFYEEYEGSIGVGDVSLKDVRPTVWRDLCGVVSQTGYIFNDTIARNIALQHAEPDYERMVQCCKITNILTFIRSLPDGFNTSLGINGAGISQGQKQRLLIARAIYKDPGYLFFDESTNSLDANNEKEVLENLQTFLKNKTVVVVAHRLSTVKNADKIVVMHQGRIIEEGEHYGLTKLKGKYFELVRNQINLNN